jgi:uncharacterized membrane protein YqaE (UPF0057 family)
MDYTIYLQFKEEHKIINKKINNELNNELKIKNLFLDAFDNKYINKNNLDNFYFIKDNILVNSDERLINILDYHKNNNIIIIQCHIKIYGGDIFSDIIDSILSVFDPIVKPIVAIGNFFYFLIKIIFWLLKFLWWFVKFVVWIFIDLLNPVNFVKDFFKTIMIITVTICKIPLELIMASFKICINIIGGWMQGFWGWDMSSLTKADKNSPYFKSFNRTAGQKIYYTQQNTVPFSIILGTILCPPMGVFMDMGTTGWLNIIICCLLTLLFYLPGLCYALLIIYS